LIDGHWTVSVPGPSSIAGTGALPATGTEEYEQVKDSFDIDGRILQSRMHSGDGPAAPEKGSPCPHQVQGRDAGARQSGALPPGDGMSVSRLFPAGRQNHKKEMPETLPYHPYAREMVVF